VILSHSASLSTQSSVSRRSSQFEPVAMRRHSSYLQQNLEYRSRCILMGSDVLPVSIG
jgi:hypothetical protein